MKSKWYLVYLIEFPIIRDKKTLKLKKYKNYLFWENLILLKAINSENAYRKAIKYGYKEEYKSINTDGDFIEWKFAGVRDLVEVGNKIYDTVELTFTEDLTKNYNLIRKLIPPKNNLSIFKWKSNLEKEKSKSTKRTNFKILSKELVLNTKIADKVLKNINKK